MREIKNRERKQPASLDRLTAHEWRGREMSTAAIMFHEAIAAHLGMSAAEWKCLGLLDQHGPSTAGRLAEWSGFTTGAITGIVDRLERAGHVRRERHATDRRSIIVHPLALGELKERVAPVFASLRRAMKSVTSRYTAAEMAAIEDYLERVTQVLRDETARVRDRVTADSPSGGSKGTP